VSFVVGLVVATFVGVAQADMVVPEPKRDACEGKSAGDACEAEGQAGTCKKTTCSRKVGGVLNPHYVDEDCMLCTAQQGAQGEGPKPTPTPAKTDPPKPDPATPDPATPEPTPPEPAKAEPTAAEPANREPAKSDAPSPEPAKAEPAKSSICSVSPDATPLASVALGLALLVLARRRRG
jgi:MYXO-CTERM domain-containing protein